MNGVVIVVVVMLEHLIQQHPTPDQAVWTCPQIRHASEMKMPGQVIGKPLRPSLY